MTTSMYASGPVGIIANTGKPSAVAAVPSVIAALDAAGYSWICDAATAAAVGCADKGVPREDLATQIAWLLVVGGDGTILDAAGLVAAHKVALLGVNPGHSLGFMTDTSCATLPQALESIQRGDYTLIERCTLSATCYHVDGTTHAYDLALNDIAFIQGTHARMITLKVSIDGAFLTTCSADGLIFATATGSTAHSMSAGGPILFPTTEAIVMTPMCPHTLSLRPVIMPKGVEIDVCPAPPYRDIRMVVDGQVVAALQPTDRVSLRLGTYKVAFIHAHQPSFVDVLRTKLQWRGDLRGTYSGATSCPDNEEDEICHES